MTFMHNPVLSKKIITYILQKFDQKTCFVKKGYIFSFLALLIALVVYLSFRSLSQNLIPVDFEFLQILR